MHTNLGGQKLECLALFSHGILQLLNRVQHFVYTSETLNGLKLELFDFLRIGLELVLPKFCSLLGRVLQKLWLWKCVPCS